MLRTFTCLLLGSFLFTCGQGARGDEIKRALFVLGIHIGGAEGVAVEFIGDPPAQRPGGIALIKRTVKDSIDIAEVLKLPTANLKAIQADIDRESFANLATRLGAARLELQASAAKVINPGAAAFYIMGIHHNGGERVALGAQNFRREDKPGTGALIERQLTRMADGTSTTGLTLKPVLEIQANLGKGASFANLADQLGKLRLKWQDELAAQPGFGGAVVAGGGKALFSQANNLTANDPRDRVRRDMFAKIHVVALRAGQTIIVDLESGDGSAKPGNFDTWLRVEDAAGKVIGENDDGGNGLNSRLEFVVPSDGNYSFVVTSYRPGATGSYTLTIRQK